MGVFAVGIDLDRMGDELREAIASSDLIYLKAWPILSRYLIQR